MQDQWQLVYLQSTMANKNTRVVLENMNHEGCEILAHMGNYMSSAFHYCSDIKSFGLVTYPYTCLNTSSQHKELQSKHLWLNVI